MMLNCKQKKLDHRVIGIWLKRKKKGAVVKARGNLSGKRRPRGPRPRNPIRAKRIGFAYPLASEHAPLRDGIVEREGSLHQVGTQYVIGTTGLGRSRKDAGRL
jgi:hypothetical protein